MDRAAFFIKSQLLGLHKNTTMINPEELQLFKFHAEFIFESTSVSIILIIKVQFILGGLKI